MSKLSLSYPGIDRVRTGREPAYTEGLYPNFNFGDILIGERVQEERLPDHSDLCEMIELAVVDILLKRPGRTYDKQMVFATVTKRRILLLAHVLDEAVANDCAARAIASSDCVASLLDDEGGRYIRFRDAATARDSLQCSSIQAPGNLTSMTLRRAAEAQTQIILWFRASPPTPPRRVI